MKKLVITEKANAARRISTILSDGKSKTAKVSGANVITFVSGGDEYSVISLRGHIIELDYPEEFNDWGASSPVDLVYAPQVKTVKVKTTLSAIRSLMESADISSFEDVDIYRYFRQFKEGGIAGAGEHAHARRAQACGTHRRQPFHGVAQDDDRVEPRAAQNLPRGYGKKGVTA